MGESIEDLRKDIDSIDEEILRLLNKRAQIARKIGEIKKKEGKEIHVPERERKIFERLSKLNKEKYGEDFPTEAVFHIYREIISACLSLEKPLKVVYLGPKATFTHQAALEYFGFSAQYISCSTIRDVFIEVESGRADYGIVPVENTIEGIVNHTLDMFLESDLLISGEVILPINLHLLSTEECIDSIKKICSHRHAIGQSKGWIEKNIPYAQIVEVDSTAKACEIALEESGVGAIASEVASYTYHLNILAKNIQDSGSNFTRFLIISKRDVKSTGKDKTSLLFAVRDEVGALYKALESFYKYGVNLTKIESRPSKRKVWDYVFFVDLEGHKENEPVKKALEELKKKSQMIKVLGSYPKAII